MSAMRRIPGEYGAGKKKDADGAAGKGRAGKGRDYSGKSTGKTGRYPDKEKSGNPAPSGPGTFRGKRPYEKRDDSVKSPSFRPKVDYDDKSARPWKQDQEKPTAHSRDSRNSGNTGDRPWNKGKSSPRNEESSDKPRSYSDDTPRKGKFSGSGETGSRPYRKRLDKDEKPSGDFSRGRKAGEADDHKTGGDFKRSRPPYKKEEGSDRPRSFRAKRFEKPDHYRKPDETGDKPVRRKFSDSPDTDRKPYSKRESGTPGEERKFSGSRDKFKTGSPAGESRYKGRKTDGRPGKKPSAGFAPKIKEAYKNDGTIRLNKYIANSGICSRREADTLIESGAVSVNGKIVTELGTRITREDKVQFGGETLSIEKKVYLLLNKPKGYITTVDDPQERNTVMMLIKDACRERIYPVGRLDRNTSGLLLFTNDGDIAKKLTHPGHKVRKVYHVELDKALSKGDMLRLSEGVELEDGLMAVDEIAYTGAENNKKNIGVVVHSGKNRVVRRLFEALEYDVVKLDRVAFANLTKKDLPRGRWRMLDEKEISLLQMI
ncbi:MAG: pseudouridine synthase [Bacteroidales bacterium]|nr:pseudouridine synthase [Bacteroidales bacterium]